MAENRRCENILWQSAFVKLEFRTYNDHGTARALLVAEALASGRIIP